MIQGGIWLRSFLDFLNSFYVFTSSSKGLFPQCIPTSPEAVPVGTAALTETRCIQAITFSVSVSKLKKATSPERYNPDSELTFFLVNVEGDETH